MCVLIFCNVCVKYFSFLAELNDKLPKTYIRLLVKYPLFLSDFNETWISSTDFRKIPVLNIMKIPSVGEELFHADGWTDGPIWRSWYSLFAILQTRLKVTKISENTWSTITCFSCLCPIVCNRTYTCVISRSKSRDLSPILCMCFFGFPPRPHA
jgi:hypothetical protein